jgi:hypothetical protein
VLIFSSWKIFYQPLFLFISLHEICKTIRIVISNSLKCWFSVPGRFFINPYFYLFPFMHVLIDSLNWKTLNSVLDIELTYRVTRNLFKLVKNNLYRHFKFIEVAFSLPGRFSINSYFYFFSFMSVLIDSLILKTFNSVLDIDKQIL